MIAMSWNSSERFTRVFVIVVCLLFFITQLSFAAPLDKSEVEELKRTNSWAVKPCGGSEASSTSSEGPAVMIGDSITVGANEYGDLKKELQAANIEPIIDASGGRAISYRGSTDPKTSGFEALQDNKKEVEDANYLIIALGTNSEDNFKKNATKLIENAKSYNPNIQIFWVEMFATAPSLNTEEVNSTIKQVAESENFTIIKTADKSIELSSDKIHPTAEGAKTFSKLIASSVGENTSTTTTATSQCVCSSGGAFSGSISPGVGNGLTPKGKESLQKAVIAASEKHGTDPNFVASFYYTENSRTDDSTNNANSAASPPVTGDGKWREPPAPFGSGSAWPAMNAYTAFGPFQFITSTWQAYKPPGTNDTSDRNDLNIAAEAAAKYLAALGGKQGADEAALRKAAWGYNHSDTYVQSVINTYKHLSSGGSTDVSGGDICVDTGGGGGFQAISGDRAEIVKKILDSTKLKLGNYGNASTQRTDIQNELSDDALMVLAAAVTQSGVNIPINALKSDHGPRGAHGQGNAIDIGYYGNGDSRHTSQGDKLYKFLYNNREKLNIDQMIWKNPPKGYKCLFGGKPADCLASYGQGTMNQHYHHIHVGV